jgi:hypothetical protein
METRGGRLSNAFALLFRYSNRDLIPAYPCLGIVILRVPS